MKQFKIMISYQYAHFGCIKKVSLRYLFYAPPKTQVLHDGGSGLRLYDGSDIKL